MWANILFPTHFLIGSYANQLPYFSRFFYFKIITSAIIWTKFKRAAHQSKFGDKTEQFVKGNLYKNRKITATVFDKLDISNEDEDEAVLPPKACYIHIWKSNSSYPCIKYDHFLHSKIQRSLAPNLSVIEPNAFSFLTLW